MPDTLRTGLQIPMLPQSDDAVSLKQVLDFVEPERIGTGRFRGRSLELKWGYVFGGQFLVS